ncbi:1-(5-phosphoribosyl)-5-[(5-phosphoribosylamino)methylideneamino] imidazole-4-carboxamide isomerase [Candidatus Tremblaya phenacola]|uniref:1-(5-phosphoribosyl)-5-[(5-phosphoribosylamino)methylideneamino] imidazole-4-carboxamide isomerase n=1 Tax=Candidatus Tremblayella phenacoccinincola TaxID=1010676 RepID=A0A2G0V6Z0_9PROT|nr:1-(5-phosphoribosyl)-5-[(5-phosphoribosylamino)methylideneamino] imidazole-4-carboxamide isomerase [Candidatus Tremblaya phenacola]PHN16229.1 1-(5-phosphoribosyl)-5-[(5-phosphoribosylamino)methylideneamino] imidazole-4-carboxamide isomerase [Candidatus Tremblaya phenacola]
MIIPSIDLMFNSIVRLYQGNYQCIRKYNLEPLYYIKYYIGKRSNIIHLVDLTGAKTPLKRQVRLISNIVSKCKSITLQVGGGIRNSSDIYGLLKLGTSRIVIGSIAIKEPRVVQEWLTIYGPERIVLALDICNGSNGSYSIYINGWQSSSNNTIENVLNHYSCYGIKHILCTDISRDGTFIGVNLRLYKYLLYGWPKLSFQSSGGVKSLNDIIKLRYIGIKNIIVGRAFIENRIAFMEAIECWQNV